MTTYSADNTPLKGMTHLVLGDTSGNVVDIPEFVVHQALVNGRRDLGYALVKCVSRHSDLWDEESRTYDLSKLVGEDGAVTYSKGVRQVTQKAKDARGKVVSETADVPVYVIQVHGDFAEPQAAPTKKARKKRGG